MLTVHHLNNSRSQRVLWLLEELGVEYEIRRYERHPKTKLAPKELRDIHPLGKSPVVTDEDLVVAESGAIVEYLVDTYGDGRFRPASGSPEFLRYRYWVHYAEGSATTPLLLKIVFDELPRQGPWAAKPILGAVSRIVNKEYVGPQIKLHMDYWEGELSKGEYFVGDEFTAADILMSYPLETVVAYGLTSAYPKISALVACLHERPAYQRAIERGGEYSLKF
ncbi:MAG: glutathione S-transferase family protein [Bradymonadaceae bacterium]